MATTTEKQTGTRFRRKERVGFNVIGFDAAGEVKYVKVIKRGEFERRGDDALPFIDVIELEDGEEGRMWLDGALKHNIDKLLEKNKLPFCLEIKFRGKEPAMVEIDGKKQETMVNTYDMWVIEDEA